MQQGRHASCWASAQGDPRHPCNARQLDCLKVGDEPPTPPAEQRHAVVEVHKHYNVAKHSATKHYAANTIQPKTLQLLASDVKAERLQSNAPENTKDEEDKT